LKNPNPPQFKPLTATLTYYATFITLGMTQAIIGPALPWLARNTTSRLDQVSVIFIASSLGYMAGSQIGGWTYDRIQGHRVQALALLAISLGISLVPMQSSLWLLVAILFLLGISQGTLDAGGNTLLTWIHGEKLGPYMNSLHFFFGVGSFLAPLIFARMVLVTSNIHWAYWLIALLILPISTWMWFLPSPPIRRRITAVSEDGSINGLFLLIVLFFVFTVGLELGFGNWIYTFSSQLNLTDETGAAYLTSAFWGALSVGRLIGIGISSRFHPRFILLADMIGCLFAFTIIFLWPSSLLALWIGTIMMGLSIASVFATGLAFADQHVSLSGVMTGWILVGGGVGGMVIPWLIGQLFERVGPSITMPVLLVNNLIAFGILLALLQPLRKKIKNYQSK
jgi:FHS family Na+ dependent glucose MFS transporter 1